MHTHDELEGEAFLRGWHWDGQRWWAFLSTHALAPAAGLYLAANTDIRSRTWFWQGPPGSLPVEATTEDEALDQALTAWAPYEFAQHGRYNRGCRMIPDPHTQRFSWVGWQGQGESCSRSYAEACRQVIRESLGLAER